MPVFHELPSACREVSSWEGRVAEYLRLAGGREALPPPDEEEDFRVFPPLSDFSVGFLGWYGFREGASLLEIGGGFGGRVGGYLGRCAHVVVTEPSLPRARAICDRYPEADGLEVYAGDWEEISFGESFDYVVFAGGLEVAGSGTDDLRVYAGCVGKLRSLLKPRGILFVAVENRYGLRYLCGERERHTGRPFAGIDHAMGSAKGRPFSREELLEVLRMAGEERLKLYYPLPDWRMPQLIYTDGHLPEENINERLILYHEDMDTLVADERRLYRDVIRNHAFPFLANSFLAECGPGEELSDVCYVALSTDRGRDRAMATAIHGSGIVTKRPLFPEGRAYAEGLMGKAEWLEEHGVPMLEQRWDGEGIRMPYVRDETLAMYLRLCVRKDPGEFLDILDRLWDCILSSSEHVPRERNALSHRRDLPWGPILQEASIELIPLNCFYDGQSFLFFDQEYIRENYPAKYVMFRAIHYICAFDPGVKEYVSVPMLKERYGLSELWEIFRREETEKFLPEVRRHAAYRLFYRQVYPERKRIGKNIRALEARKA